MKTTAAAKPARRSSVTPNTAHAHRALQDLVGKRTVRVLADQVGCHFTHVSNILIGKRCPSTMLLEKLAKELRTPMQNLHMLLIRVQKERRRARARFANSI